MVPLPYFGSPEDAIDLAQREACHMRELGTLAPLRLHPINYESADDVPPTKEHCS